MAWHLGERQWIAFYSWIRVLPRLNRTEENLQARCLLKYEFHSLRGEPQGMPQRNWENVISPTGLSTLMLFWYSSAGSYPVVPTSPRKPSIPIYILPIDTRLTMALLKVVLTFRKWRKKTFLTSIIQIFTLRLFVLFCFNRVIQRMEACYLKSGWCPCKGPGPLFHPYSIWENSTNWNPLGVPCSVYLEAVLTLGVTGG